VSAMPRPRFPLISKHRALEAALHIIDSEGIDALSIRRLAQRLSVNGASLYHHFQDKNEIIVGAARLALDHIRAPVNAAEPWRVWMMRNPVLALRALREHPDLVPVMLRLGPLQIGATQLERTVEMLKHDGVPVGAIAPMLEALDLYAVATALRETGNGEGIETLPTGYVTPNLSDAFEHRTLTADEVFDTVCRQIIDTVVSVAAERAATALIDSVAHRRQTPVRRASAVTTASRKNASQPRQLTASTKATTASKRPATTTTKTPARKTTGHGRATA
jgi:TetR/AcrR family transcriptional regulator, tetracycline repressor protein